MLGDILMNWGVVALTPLDSKAAASSDNVSWFAEKDFHVASQLFGKTLYSQVSLRLFARAIASTDVGARIDREMFPTSNRSILVSTTPFQLIRSQLNGDCMGHSHAR